MAILNQLLSIDDLAALSADQREFLVDRLDTIIASQLRTPGTEAHNALAGELTRALGALGKKDIRVQTSSY